MSNVILIPKAIKNPAYYQYDTLPVLSFALPKQNANATSNNPAMIKLFCLLTTNSRQLIHTIISVIHTKTLC
jgi:hypothetical protein